MPIIRINTPDEEPDKRDLLIRAMQLGSDNLVNLIACDLFITGRGQPNRVEINAFEKYAPCKIGPGEQDGTGWLTGVINYNGKQFIFG